MKVLVVGGGGREHALVWKIAKSPLVKEVIAAPGNAGIAGQARCEPISADDLNALVEFSVNEAVDLVVVGPEAPLVSGLADRLTKKGIRVFGPSAAAAKLEGSKAFAKDFMQRHNIPTASYMVHDALDAALYDVEHRRRACVVKADGLAAGKGVFLCRNSYEARDVLRGMMEERQFGAAGQKVIIEDWLEGEEVSVLAICDGERFVTLIPAQDHKAAYEGDTGPNTGGMGAYAPAPLITPEIEHHIVQGVIKPTLQGMAQDGTPFRGILYAGLMFCDDKPYVLEYNVRFGDPECQPMMAMMDEDIVPLLVAAADGKLEQPAVKWLPGAALCVVLACEGYPGPYEKGMRIEGLDAAEAKSDVVVFHAGTKLDSSRLVTSGGRVLGVTARGSTLVDAARLAYGAANEIHWKGMRMRRDIGHRAL